MLLAPFSLPAVLRRLSCPLANSQRTQIALHDLMGIGEQPAHVVDQVAHRGWRFYRGSAISRGRSACVVPRALTTEPPGMRSICFAFPGAGMASGVAGQGIPPLDRRVRKTVKRRKKTTVVALQQRRRFVFARCHAPVISACRALDTLALRLLVASRLSTTEQWSFYSGLKLDQGSVRV